MRTITLLKKDLNKPWYIELNRINYKIVFNALDNDIESIVLSFEEAKENPENSHEINEIDENTLYSLFEEYDYDHKRLLLINSSRIQAYTELPIEKEHYIVSTLRNKEVMNYQIKNS